ncbi:uncharacterized protein LOC142592800 [Dermacentor variabilis]|uniref:uncharacterized protein LOC142592800 n=1 Tax=Dermacentor variabilis TaxID=34621 RepID=UPI003F5B2330
MERQALNRGMTKATQVRERRRARGLNRAEMRSLLAKLQELVPSMPRNKRLSKLEIILSVIDYIVHLETALEAHSAAHASTPVASVRHCCRRDFLLITGKPQKDKSLTEAKPALPVKHAATNSRSNVKC